MSRVTLGLCLALLLFFALLVSAPARLLGTLVASEQLVMSGFSGTLWQGSASRCMLKLGPGYLHLGRVQWSLEPLSLLSLSPRLSLDSNWGQQLISGDVVLRGERDLDFYAFEARLAADLLRQFAPVALAGHFSLQLQSLKLRDGRPVAGDGRLVWHDGAWQSPQGLLPLGSYAIDFQQAPGEALQGELLTLSGPVSASGRLRLQDDNYLIDILVSNALRLDPQVEQALSLMASPEPEGFRLKLEGLIQGE